MVVFTTGHHDHRVRAHCDHREVEGMLFEEGEHIVRGGERGVVASSACGASHPTEIIMMSQFSSSRSSIERNYSRSRKSWADDTRFFHRS